MANSLLKTAISASAKKVEAREKTKRASMRDKPYYQKVLEDDMKNSAQRERQRAKELSAITKIELRADDPEKLVGQLSDLKGRLEASETQRTPNVQLISEIFGKYKNGVDVLKAIDPENPMLPVFESYLDHRYKQENYLSYKLKGRINIGMIAYEVSNFANNNYEDKEICYDAVRYLSNFIMNKDLTNSSDYDRKYLLSIITCYDMMLNNCNELFPEDSDFDKIRSKAPGIQEVKDKISRMNKAKKLKRWIIIGGIILIYIILMVVVF